MFMLFLAIGINTISIDLFIGIYFIWSYQPQPQSSGHAAVLIGLHVSYLLLPGCDSPSRF